MPRSTRRAYTSRSKRADDTTTGPVEPSPNTRVMRINHARFVYLVSQQPAFALMIMDALSKRLRASNTVAFRTAASS